MPAHDGLRLNCPVAPACDSFGMCDCSLIIAPLASWSYVTSTAAPYRARRCAVACSADSINTVDPASLVSGQDGSSTDRMLNRVLLFMQPAPTVHSSLSDIGHSTLLYGRALRRYCRVTREPCSEAKWCTKEFTSSKVWYLNSMDDATSIVASSSISVSASRVLVYL
ncbi:hypothetical protein HPB50_025030 [Hyalomma asiaticum]|uniref:Uncharacterized protein n=1 Tax=Hyalomma asiaticum TaxID=266040 RepID=A0ACB7TBM1_HYAAI|nr:hypothetical protein HPB50_025030 [Hyalomma asiaticum]